MTAKFRIYRHTVLSSPILKRTCEVRAKVITHISATRRPLLGVSLKSEQTFQITLKLACKTPLKGKETARVSLARVGIITSRSTKTKL